MMCPTIAPSSCLGFPGPGKAGWAKEACSRQNSLQRAPKRGQHQERPPETCRGSPGTIGLSATACGEETEGWGKNPREVWEEQHQELPRGWKQSLYPPGKQENSLFMNCWPEYTEEFCLSPRPRFFSIHIIGILVWIIIYYGVFVLCIIAGLTPSLIISLLDANSINPTHTAKCSLKIKSFLTEHHCLRLTSLT